MRLRQKAGMLASGMVGGLVAAIVLMALPAMGVTGGGFVLGRANTAENRTMLKGATETANLRVQNTGDKPALSLATSSDAPPMAVSSKKKVTNLNADTVDGLDSVDLNDADTIDGLDSVELRDAETLDGIDSAAIAHDLVIAHASADIDPGPGGAGAECPAGTEAIGGGGWAGNPNWAISSGLAYAAGYAVEWVDTNPSDPVDRGNNVEVWGVCAPAGAVSGWLHE
jgi:hypothetical protein